MRHDVVEKRQGILPFFRMHVKKECTLFPDKPVVLAFGEGWFAYLRSGAGECELTDTNSGSQPLDGKLALVKWGHHVLEVGEKEFGIIAELECFAGIVLTFRDECRNPEIAEADIECWEF